jgi:hypothetical protein
VHGRADVLLNPRRLPLKALTICIKALWGSRFPVTSLSSPMSTSSSLDLQRTGAVDSYLLISGWLSPVPTRANCLIGQAVMRGDARSRQNEEGRADAASPALLIHCLVPLSSEASGTCSFLEVEPVERRVTSQDRCQHLAQSPQSSLQTGIHHIEGQRWAERGSQGQRQV